MNNKQLCGPGDEFDATFVVIIIVNIVVVIIVLLVVLIIDVFPQLMFFTNITNGMVLFPTHRTIPLRTREIECF